MHIKSRFVSAVKSFLAWLRRFGIYLRVTPRAFAVARITNRDQPELINRALWRPFAIDDEWRALYKAGQTVSGSGGSDNLFKQCRFYSTFQFAAYACSLPDGDMVECGCWHGHSTVAIATILRDRGFDGRFHVFDSFEGGLSEFRPEDESFFALSAREKQHAVSGFASSYDAVQSITAPFGFVDLHEGWIPDVFAGFEPRPLRFVHIDVDMFEPTKAALEFFWDQVVPGGVIVCDDYNSSIFEGANRAVDEFLDGRSPMLVYRVPMGSIAIVK